MPTCSFNGVPKTSTDTSDPWSFPILSAWPNLSMPSYSTHLNLIERRGKLTKRRALYGRYLPTFRHFPSAMQEVLDGWSTKHSQQPA